MTPDAAKKWKVTHFADDTVAIHTPDGANWTEVAVLRGNFARQRAEEIVRAHNERSAAERIRQYLHAYLNLQYDTGMTVRELAKEVVKSNRRLDRVAPSDGLLVVIAELLDAPTAPPNT